MVYNSPGGRARKATSFQRRKSSKKNTFQIQLHSDDLLRQEVGEGKETLSQKNGHVFGDEIKQTREWKGVPASCRQLKDLLNRRRLKKKRGKGLKENHRGSASGSKKPLWDHSKQNPRAKKREKELKTPKGFSWAWTGKTGDIKRSIFSFYLIPKKRDKWKAPLTANLRCSRG